MNTTLRTNPMALRTLGTLLAAATAMAALPGCGGGEGPDTADGSRAQVTTVPGIGPVATATPPTLPVRGCVVDEYYIPRSGTPVRLLAANGQLLGWAQSGRDGSFVFSVPRQQRMTVAVDKAGGETLAVAVGASLGTPSSCLVDPQG
jgi:hypothetical protein